MFGGKEPPAYKFNGGEKLIFWIAMIGGGLVIASGFVLLFPFYGTSVAGMELAEIVHSVVAVLLSPPCSPISIWARSAWKAPSRRWATATSTSTGPRSTIACGTKRKCKAAPPGRQAMRPAE